MPMSDINIKSFNLVKNIRKSFDLYIGVKKRDVWIFYSPFFPGFHMRGMWTTDDVWGDTEIWHR